MKHSWLVAEVNPEAELARKCLEVVWEQEPDEYGEHGLIEELRVKEDVYLVDVTEMVKGGLTVLDDLSIDPIVLMKHDSTEACYEAHVKCCLQRLFRVGSRYFADYSVKRIDS